MENHILSRDKLTYPIEPLSNQYLRQAIGLAKKVFFYMNHREDRPEKMLRLSLNPNRETAWALEGIHSIQYFVLIDPTSEEVVGLTGLRVNRKDTFTNIGWLGWFCIDPYHHGKGLGVSLLDWSVRLALRRGFRELRIYKQQKYNYEKADAIYDTCGFKIYKISEDPDLECKILYLRRRLKQLELQYLS